MGMPAVTEKQVSNDEMLENGYQSLFVFEDDPDVAIFDVDVQSPDLKGGEPIDITTMLRSVKRAKAPRALSEDGDITVNFGIASGTRDQLEALINRKQSVTEWYPDGSAYSWHGFAYDVTFKPRAEGEFPMGTLKICITNVDPDDGSESSYVYTPPTGTA